MTPTSHAAATTVPETERTYESSRPIDPSAMAAIVAELAAGAGLGPVGEATELTLSATYVDTADLRLLRRGVTLRCRRGGHDDGWHLKLPAGEDRRDEVREPLGADDTPPARLTALSRALHRGVPLQPVVALATVRREWALVDRDGRAVASLTDDRVTARPLDAGAGAAAWSEIEVELHERGDHDLLDRIESALAGVGVRRSHSASKVGRVLAERLPAGATRPVADRDASAGDAVLAYLWEQVDALVANDPHVRLGAPEPLHKMRVASRRMRSALQAFRTVLDRDVTDPVVGELRWLAGELGRARDLDVQHERITAALASLPPELVLGPAGADTDAWFAARRAGADARMMEALDGDRYVALLDTLDALLARPPRLPEAARPARAVLPERVARLVRRTERARRAAWAHEPGPERDAALHEMRKSAKRLRYAAEATAPVVGAKADKLVTRVKAVQELLGEHQDSVVARPLLRQLGAAGHVAERNGFTFGWLMRDELARTERAEAELDATWRALRRRARWLRRAGRA